MGLTEPFAMSYMVSSENNAANAKGKKKQKTIQLQIIRVQCK